MIELGIEDVKEISEFKVCTCSVWRFSGSRGVLADVR